MELKIVLLVVCVGFVHGASYKAAVVDEFIAYNEKQAVSMIQQAAQLNVDILMLPKMWANTYGNTNMMSQALSNAARQAKMYVVAQIAEDTTSHETNYVFDRNGTITDAPALSHIGTLATDFGVTFGLVSQEDLLTYKHAGIKNVIAFGYPAKDSHFLYASSGAWAHTARSNLLTSDAIFGGKTRQHGGLVVAELDSDRPVSFAVEHTSLQLNLSQYTTAPLSSGKTVKELCHDTFCCSFDVTTSAAELPYSLLAYSGVQELGSKPVRVQTCALVACADQGCQELNSKTAFFEKVAISAHFNPDSTQYPLITAHDVTYDDFHLQRNGNQASIELDEKSVTSFGIFSVSPDLEGSIPETETDDMSELFDYVWIRLRVAIFIVSIYVMEML